MLASKQVAGALVLSLLLHGFLFLAIEFGHLAGLWNSTLLFSKPKLTQEEQMARLLELARQQEQEMPLVFVEVDPDQASEEAPKDAKYYSALNSRAANPDTTLDMLVPKIEGKQDKVPQTIERARAEPQPLQAAPPPPQTPKQPEPVPAPAEPERPPQRTLRPGDLAMATPAEKPRELPQPKRPETLEQPKPKPPRPRTLEAARQQKGLIGEKVQQPGGVKRFALQSSFDVRATPFGAYDAAIIAAIQKRWYDLLDSRDYAANYSGRVVLEFRLNSDGRVTEIKVSENGVTEILGLLCQRAVQDPAPFAPWPNDLRRLVGKEYREVRFTFYYN